MQNKKIINNKDLRARLNNYCQINHLNIDIFEIAQIGKGLGTGDRKTLYGPQKVKNKAYNKCYTLYLYFYSSYLISSMSPSLSYPPQFHKPQIQPQYMY